MAGRTEEQDNIFFSSLVEGLGPTLAAEKAKYNKSSVYYFRKKFNDFKRRWKDASSHYEEALLQEVDRRGRRGVEKPVFYRGEVVGNVTEYSDTLLMFRLKCIRPGKYEEQKQNKIGKEKSTGDTQPVINLHLNVTDNTN